MGIVTFHYRSGEDALHRGLIDAMLRDGYAFLTSTTPGGSVALRLFTIHPDRTVEDVRGTVSRLESLAAAQVR